MSDDVFLFFVYLTAICTVLAFGGGVVELFIDLRERWLRRRMHKMRREIRGAQSYLKSIGWNRDGEPANYYIDSEHGDDDWDGLSDTHVRGTKRGPWRTMKHLMVDPLPPIPPGANFVFMSRKESRPWKP